MTVTAANSAARQARLSSERDYQRVIGGGRKASAGMLVLYHMPGAQPQTRFGVAVTRKLRRAVDRNRVKRHLRHLWRLHHAAFPAATDYILLARIPKPVEFRQMQAWFAEVRRRFKP